MKNKRLKGTVVILIAALMLPACKGKAEAQTGGGRRINSAEDLTAYLNSQPANSPDKPIKVAMNANDIMLKKIAEAITSAGKYVSLDLTGSPLTTIPERTFRNCTALTGIVIPNSVTSVGSGAFDGCTNLNITWYYNPALTAEYFRDYLKSVIIPNSVTSIGREAFYECTNLTGITIPNSVTSIELGVFAGCTSLTSVTIPNSVTSIGDEAFYECYSLTSITIPNSVTSIGDDTFRYCTGLTAINVSAQNSAYTSDDGVLYNKDKTTLIQYPAKKTGTSFIIPNSVTSIGDWAFNNCTSLTSIIIPNSVTSIGNWAFFNCTRLASVTIGNGVTSIGEEAFSETTWLANQPDGLVYAGKVALKYKGTVPVNTSINLRDDTKGIAYAAFSGSTSLTSVTIPNSVINIGKNAFWNCKGLTRVNIGNGVTSIGEEAFSRCTSLTSVTISNSVTSIEQGTFFGCTGLTSVTIPDSVTSIGQGAFANCTGLTSVTIPNSVTSIGELTFYGCTGLTSVKFERANTNIDAKEPFLGDLRTKYLAGGIGTYTTTNPGLEAVWTKK